MTLFVECTYTHNSQLNTGIQRVVRNIAQEFLQLSDDEVSIQLVSILGNEFVEIEQLNILNSSAYIPSSSMKIKLKWLFFEARKKIASLFSSHKIKHFLLAPKYDFGLIYLLDKYIIQLFSITKKNASSPKTADMKKGDILLLLDSSWHLNILEAVKNIKKSDVKIIAIIYDLIPLSHPQFCDESLIWFFENWFDGASKMCDGFIAISQSVENDVRKVIKNKSSLLYADKYFNNFVLGSDIKKDIERSIVPKNVKKLFKKNTNTYLLVSTIEPRKNHAYLLDAFDVLWGKNHDIQLVFIGRLGWKNQDILNRIYTHPRYNTHLFMFNNLDDTALMYCYQHSTMLLFPSYAEGYGLPIVESLNYGLPVMASDIAVHREVGKDIVNYFDINNPDDLVKKIIDVEENKTFVKVEKVKTLTWKESAASLLSAIKMSHEKI